MQPSGIAEILGMSPGQSAQQLGLADLVEAGLPLSALDRVAELVSPGDPKIKFRFVPKATLARRRQSASNRLTSEESDKVARVAKVMAAAQDVFGEKANARRFLSLPHPMLSGKPPVDLAMASGAGADAVLGLLGQIAHGVAV